MELEYIKIPKPEYDQLLKYRDIVNRIEEDIHEELNVKPIEDERAIAKMKKLNEETKAGKRKTISDEEFTSKYKHLL
jgi:hypothetical protein